MVIFTKMAGIRPRRQTLGLTMEACAREVGVTRQAWCKWESGDTLPAAGLLPGIAEVLQCSIEELYRPTTGAGPMRASAPTGDAR